MGLNIPETKTITISRGGADHSIELTEEDAFLLLAALRNAFGWAGTEFTRGDVETLIERELTDKEWESVCRNYFWERLLPERATQEGWYCVDEVISDLNLVSLD